MNYRKELEKLARWWSLPSLLLTGATGWTLFIHGYMTLGIERGIPFLRVAITISTLYTLTFMLITPVIFPLIEKRARKIQRFKRAAKIGMVSSFSILGALFLGLAGYALPWMIVYYGCAAWLIICLILIVLDKIKVKKAKVPMESHAQ
ncbi:hypothetical protein [Rossellomorea marisflavi]|uniref:hypothetical protein n=1 Tax=Rossellomorea marisflavi TaxID=189381 RepID=UPI003D2EB65D